MTKDMMIGQYSDDAFEDHQVETRLKKTKPMGRKDTQQSEMTNGTKNSTLLEEIDKVRLEDFDQFIISQTSYVAKKEENSNQHVSEKDLKKIMNVLKGQSLKDISKPPIVAPEQVQPFMWSSEVKNKMKFLSRAYLDLMNKNGVNKMMNNVMKVMKMEELRKLEEEASNQNFENDKSRIDFG